MRSGRGQRGLINRAGKIEGSNYKGDPNGIVTPWGGGNAGVVTPTIGQYPTIPLAIDDNDDGSKTMDRVDATARGDRKSTRNTTKAKLRWPFMSLANWIAWLMGLAD